MAKQNSKMRMGGPEKPPKKNATPASKPTPKKPAPSGKMMTMNQTTIDTLTGKKNRATISYRDVPGGRPKSTIYGRSK